MAPAICKMMNNKHALVSIIIPVFNREKYITDCVQSALNQTHKNIEIIIVDNASTDRTWDICVSFSQKDSRVKVFRNQINIGPVRNWIECVNNAQGEIIKILWSDDVITETFIEEAISELNEDIGFVYSSVRVYNEGTGLFNDCYFNSFPSQYSSKDFIKAALFTKTVPVSPGCAIFRTRDVKNNLLKVIPNSFGIDISNVAIGPDLLLFLITASEYRKIAFINKPLTTFRNHPGSITSSDSNGKLEFHYGLAKAFFVDRYFTEHKTRMHASLFAQQLLFRIRKYSFGKYSIDEMFDSREARNLVWFWYFIRHITYLVIRRIRYTLRDGLNNPRKSES
jgi:glycosyltransferase involved in cell wall biosynthesis